MGVCMYIPCENALHYCMHELEPLHFGSHSHVEQHSGTSDNGHSEERTTSLQRTNCMPPAENCMHSTYISTSEILTPLTSEQLTNLTSRTVIMRTKLPPIMDNNTCERFGMRICVRYTRSLKFRWCIYVTVHA